jgi:mono/diheme cytochrome c family protein
MKAMLVRVMLALLIALVFAGRSTFSQTPAAPAASPVTYTEEQAGRGGEVFSRVCLSCHSRKDVSNPDFRVKWNGRSALDFLELVRSTMPQDDPGSLERTVYVNITAYVAKLNGIAAGSVPLPDDEAGLKQLVWTLPRQATPRAGGLPDIQCTTRSRRSQRMPRSRWVTDSPSSNEK